MSNTVIPRPNRAPVMDATQRKTWRVVVGTRTVVYDYNEVAPWAHGAVLEFSILDTTGYGADRAVCAAFRTCQPVTPVVVSTDVSCGGRSEPPTVNGVPDDIAAVLAAIPDFYAFEQDRDLRRTLRATYRWLSRTSDTPSA